MKNLKVGKFDLAYPVSSLNITELNRDKIESHIEKFIKKLSLEGWMDVIKIDKLGNVVEGNHRALAAMEMGLKTVPVYIIDWIDPDNKKSLLMSIIGMNNGNESWKPKDYLKKLALFNSDYEYAYKVFLSNEDNITPGNLINCYFVSADDRFKKGESKIGDKKFSDYLVNNLTRLVKNYGTKKIQAYPVREIIKVAHKKAQGNVKVMDGVFKFYEDMASADHPSLTSIEKFRPVIEFELNQIKKRLNV